MKVSVTSKIGKKILRLIPATKKAMISEIGLVNIAYFKHNIQPQITISWLGNFLREGTVYQPREGFYKKS